MIKTEAQMDPHVRRYFTEQGFTVIGEVSLGGESRRPDLVGRKSDAMAGKQYAAIEMTAAPSIDRRHWASLIHWRSYAQWVWGVVLSKDADRWIESEAAQLDLTIASALNIGVLVIDSQTGEAIPAPLPPAEDPGSVCREVAHHMESAFERYEKAGINPVGGQPGNAGHTERSIAADRLYQELVVQSAGSGWATKYPLSRYSAWFDGRKAEAIKRSLEGDERFVFVKIGKRIHVGLAPKVEEVEG